MAGDWRTTKTKRKRELPTRHETAPQRTGCISQPKCKKGSKLKHGAQQSETLVRRNLQSSPSLKAWQSPDTRAGQSLHVSFEVFGGDWVGTGMQFLSSCCCFMSCSDHELSQSPGRAARCQEEVSRLPEAKAGKIFPSASSRWPPSCSPPISTVLQAPYFPLR